MWHEKEAGYPAIERTDYWDHAVYTPREPLVRLLPILFNHSTVLTKGVTQASDAALALDSD